MTIFIVEGAVSASSNAATFTCDDGHEIPGAWVCDGGAECHNGEDEKHCKYMRLRLSLNVFSFAEANHMLFGRESLNVVSVHYRCLQFRKVFLY